MFLVTTEWRGRLHIEDMRLFQDQVEAARYYTKLIRRDSHGQGLNVEYHWVRGYMVASDDTPTLIWSRKNKVAESLARGLQKTSPKKGAK